MTAANNGHKKCPGTEEEEIQKAFEEEIKKPYYDVFYLDNFKLPYENLDVSVVIPTYNRCPHKPNGLKGELNPLAWAVKSVLLQKPRIAEIIIVDDASEDYTREVVESFKKEAKERDIYITYIKNKKHLGNSLTRHIGASSANSRFIFFADDDCILTPYCVFGSVYTFEKIEQRGINIAVVNLPTYFRRSTPKDAISRKDIGRLDFIRGQYTTNKESFPAEYLNGKEEKKFLDVELHILEPFPITNLNTFALCSKKAYEDIGGFKKNVIQRGLDREFGCQLIENGYDIYFSPDPKFHCVHGSYGLSIERPFEGPDWFRKSEGMISLKKAMQECSKPAKNSGMRIDTKNYLTQQIISFLVLIYPRNKRGALKWIKKVYNDFVLNADTSIFAGVSLEVPSEEERKKMWGDAINEGLSFIRRKENVEFKKVEKIFKKVENDERNFEEAIKMISEI